MTLTTHAAIGISVAQVTHNPLIGFALAFGVHYITDIIPHGDEFIYWRHVHNTKDLFAVMTGVADTVILLLLAYAVLLFQEPVYPMVIVAAIIGGILPDVLMTLHTKSRDHFGTPYTGVKRIVTIYHEALLLHHTFHNFFHDMIRTPIRFRTGLVGQLLFLSLFVHLYFF